MSAFAMTRKGSRAARWALAMVLALIAATFAGAVPAKAATTGKLVVDFSALDTDSRACFLVLDASDLHDWRAGHCLSWLFDEGGGSVDLEPGSYVVQYYAEGHGAAFHPGVETAWSAQRINIASGQTVTIAVTEDSFGDVDPDTPDGKLVIDYAMPDIPDIEWTIELADPRTRVYRSEYVGGGHGQVELDAPPGHYRAALYGYSEDGHESYWSLLGNTADQAQSPVIVVGAGETAPLEFDAADYEFGVLEVDFESADAQCAAIVAQDYLAPNWWYSYALPGDSDRWWLPNRVLRPCVAWYDTLHLAPGAYVVDFDIDYLADDTASYDYSGGSASVFGTQPIEVVAGDTVVAEYVRPAVGLVDVIAEDYEYMWEGLTPAGEFNPLWMETGNLPYGDYQAVMGAPYGYRAYDAPFPWDSSVFTVDSEFETFDLSDLPMAELSGTVTRTGHPTVASSNVPREVILFGYSPSEDAFLEAGRTTTDAAGDYAFTGLAPGAYKVGFAEYSSVYAERIQALVNYGNYDLPGPDSYFGGDDLSSAEVIVLEDGDVETGIDGVIEYGLIELNFNDIGGNQFADDILWMAEKGISTGYDDGTFRPQASVSRQAMAAFMYRLAGEPVFTPPAVSPFTDVPTSHPFYKEITWMADADISTGYDEGGGKFSYRPNDSVSRQAMSAFMYRLAGEPPFTAPGSSPFIDVASTSPFYAEIAWMADAEISTGYDEAGGKKSYRPGAAVSRQAMAAFMHRLEPLLP